jgi:hypothetical protein
LVSKIQHALNFMFLFGLQTFDKQWQERDDVVDTGGMKWSERGTERLEDGAQVKSWKLREAKENCDVSLSQLLIHTHTHTHTHSLTPTQYGCMLPKIKIRGLLLAQAGNV